MKIRPTVIRLIPEGNPRGSVACRRSHKSANCQAATEWQVKMIDMRIKPDWLNDSSVTQALVVTESSYKRHSEILDLTLEEEEQEHISAQSQ